MQKDEPEKDIALIRKIAQRDAVAFAAFYDHAAKIVFTLLSRFLKDRAESEDILQETFWQVWRQAAAYDPALGSPMVWVMAMAKTQGMIRLKKRSTYRRRDKGSEASSIQDEEISNGLDAPLSTPQPSVRMNLLNAIEQETNITHRFPVAPLTKNKSFWVRFPWLIVIGWGLAGIFGAILFGRLNTHWQETSHRNDEIAAMRHTLSEKEASLRALHRDLSEREEHLALIEAQQTVVVVLTGVPSSRSNARGKLFWNAERNAGLFFAFDLPLPPNEKTYQVWAIQRAEAVDLGVFSSLMETGSFKIKPIPNPSEAVLFFTVTVEPIGGSLQPTGEILLKGTIGGRS